MNRLTPAHHGGMLPPPPGTGQLARYGSAPGSFLAALADSAVTRGDPAPAPPPVSRFYSAESSGLTSCESTCRTDAGRPLERAYGGSGEIRVPPPPHHHHHQQQQQNQALAPLRPAAPVQQGQPPAVSPLFRHSSSPAGLLSRLMADPHGTSSRRRSCEPPT